MPPRSSPTARQVRLGVELRKMREAAGMPAREAGALLGGGQPQISHIESGRYGISEERLRRLAAFYSCSDSALIDALAAMTHEQRGEGWWEAYRGVLPAPMLDLAELEHHATGLRTIQITDIPGLFQTEEYARAVFGSTIPALPPAELDARVALRMQRQATLRRDGAPRYEAVIHEAALRMRFGGRRVALTQLEHLREQSDRPGVSVRVIPFSSQEYAGASRAMLYAVGPVPALDTVQIEAAHGVSFLDADAHLRRYRSTFETLASSALSEHESRDLIHAIAQEL
ncbi:helix-turn-helix domain-containing protein [Streptomyces palmae]|uniref:XRE family transcriptional regulator n=1 Tax=Streptomyces palmae TaxID=1701085 RepID=A0A4Z0GCA6_9ACTN|nr:helix-turn-helix transcriptional regulator [Streptomyces palmae]TGA93749.1 XRE family transcriptional regulator [Streptomyces palmae]